MSNSDIAATDPTTGNRWFPTTRWATVVAAQDTESKVVADALEELCRTYWYPLYAYIRRRGYPLEQAEDLTQGFFEQFLRKDHVTHVDRAKGKLRSYLLGALNHFLADAEDHRKRLKRGGGVPVISLDVSSGEGRYLREPIDDLSPDRLFDRRWALTVLEQVLARLGREYAGAGKAAWFRRMKHFLMGNDDGGAYTAAARELDATEGALRVAVHRLRKRYGQLLRDEIAQSVAGPDEVEEELRHLAAVLAR